MMDIFKKAKRDYPFIAEIFENIRIDRRDEALLLYACPYAPKCNSICHICFYRSAKFHCPKLKEVKPFNIVFKERCLEYYQNLLRLELEIIEESREIHYALLMNAEEELADE